MYKYQKSAYAINKFSENIVYRFADGTSFEVTFEQYIAENPTKTVEDFKVLKEMSDEIYRLENNSDSYYSSKTVGIEFADECESCFENSPEENMMTVFQNSENQELINSVLEKLTETQRRRFILYAINGYSSWKIAEIENVSHQSILECLESCQKKIKKILKKF